MVRMESPPSAGSSTSSRRDGGGVLARECEGGSAVWSCKRARSSAAWRCMQSPCETRSVGAGVRNGRRAHERVVFGTGAVMAHEGAAITGCGDAKRRLSRPLGARRSAQTGWAGNGQDRRDERERHLNHRCPLSFDGLSAQSARSNASESRGAVSITPVRGEMSLLGGDARPSGFQRPGARGGRVDLAPQGGPVWPFGGVRCSWRPADRRSASGSWVVFEANIRMSFYVHLTGFVTRAGGMIRASRAGWMADAVGR